MKEEKNFKRNKSIDIPPANISCDKHTQQSSIYKSQTSKKDQDYQRDFWHFEEQKQGCSYDFPAISANSQ